MSQRRGGRSALWVTHSPLGQCRDDVAQCRQRLIDVLGLVQHCPLCTRFTDLEGRPRVERHRERERERERERDTEREYEERVRETQTPKEREKEKERDRKRENKKQGEREIGEKKGELRNRQRDVRQVAKMNRSLRKKTK